MKGPTEAERIGKLRHRPTLLAGTLVLCWATIAAASGTQFSGTPDPGRTEGGTRLVLQVHVNDAIYATVDQALERFRDELRVKNIAAEVQKRAEGNTPYLVITGIPPERASDVQALVMSKFREWNLASLAGKPNAHAMSLRKPLLATIRDQALQQTILIIRNRLNRLGVAQTSVQPYGQGTYEISVLLPSLPDPTRVKDIIQTTGLLQLKLVTGGPYSDRQSALGANGGILPPNAQLLPGRSASDGGAASQAWYLVSHTSAATGRDLSGAEPGTDENGRPCVNFTLTRDGAARLSLVTEANVGKRLAMVLDNRVISVTVIRSKISDRGKITGFFTAEHAGDLALILRSGALPASVTYLSEQVVGP
jgi:preprotein translocase subunit SecD